MAQSPTPTINIGYSYAAPVNGFYAPYDCFVYFSGPYATPTYYYTLDGSTPTTSSTQWDWNNITISADTTVKVIAIDMDPDLQIPMDPSEVATLAVPIADPATVTVGTPTVTGRNVEVVLTFTTPDLDANDGYISWGDGSPVNFTGGQLATINSTGTLTLTHTYAGTGSYDIQSAVYSALTSDYDYQNDVAVTHEWAHALAFERRLSVPQLNNVIDRSNTMNAISPDGRYLYMVYHRSGDSDYYYLHVHAIDTITGDLVGSREYYIYDATSPKVAVADDGTVFIGTDRNGNLVIERTDALLQNVTVYDQWNGVSSAMGRGTIENLPISAYGTTVRIGTTNLEAGVPLEGVAAVGGRQFVTVGTIDGSRRLALWEVNASHTTLTQLATSAPLTDSDNNNNRPVVCFGGKAVMLASVSGSPWADRYALPSLGLIDSVFPEGQANGQIYGFHDAVSVRGMYYVTDLYRSTIEILRPAGISDPTVSIDEHTGWSGLNLGVDITANADADTELAQMVVTWGDGNTYTITADLEDFATGSTLYYAYAAAGLYTPSVTVTDAFGLMDTATFPARINVGPYTLASDITADAVGGTFTLDGTYGGTTTITLNATARQKLQYCLDNEVNAYIGIQFTSDVEDENWVYMYAAPVLSLNSGALAVNAHDYGSSVYAQAWSKYATGTGITHHDWSPTLGYEQWTYRIFRSAMRFDLPTTDWALISSASVTLTNAIQPMGTTLTGRVTVFSDDDLEVWDNEDAYYRIGLEQTPADPAQSNIADRHVAGTETLEAGDSYAVLEIALDATALQKLNYCRQNAIPCYVGVYIDPSTEYADAGPVGLDISSLTISLNGGEQAATLSYGDYGSVYYRHAENGTYSVTGLYSFIIWDNLVPMACRPLASISPTYRTISATLTITMATVTTLTDALVSAVVFSANSFASAREAFCEIGHDCLRPTISPASGVQFSPLSVSISDVDAGVTAIYYTNDGSTPTPESDEYTGVLNAPGVRGTYVVKALAEDAAGRLSVVRTATLPYQPTPVYPPQTLLVL